jgi:hypothetical protein
VDNEIDNLAVIYARAPSKWSFGSYQLDMGVCTDADD